MKKYHVNVNGNDYEIAIELLSESEIPTTSTAHQAAPAPKAVVPSGGQQITSPMPGTILTINASVGDSVKKGQVLMILEAMKMENEILAPVDGKVTSIAVTKGATVESGTLLCLLS